MKVSKRSAVIVLAVALFLGSLLGGGRWLFAQEPEVTPPTTGEASEPDSTSVDEAQVDDDDDGQEVEDDDDGEDGEDNDDDDDDDGNENSAALQKEANISAADAEAAALAIYPKATVLETELERERGQLIYEVELDNGLEVVIDATNGKVLGTEVD